MVKKTVYSKSQIIEILSYYNIGTYVNHKLFSEGNVNTNIFLETRKGKFALRVYENKKSQEINPEIKLLYYLKKNNFPCPKPIPLKSNKFILNYNDKDIVVYSFIEGKHFKELNEIQLKNAAKNLAKLHNLTSNFRPKYFKIIEPNDIKSIHKNIKLAKKLASKNNLDLTLNIDFIQNRLNKINIPPNLRKGICHGDPDWNNMFFSGNKLVGFIDFDWAKDDILINDLNSYIGMFCFDDEKELNYKKSKQILDEYQDVRPLNYLEKKYFYDLFELNYIWWFSYKLTDENHIKKYSSKLMPEAKPFKKFDKIDRIEFYNKLFK